MTRGKKAETLARAAIVPAPLLGPLAEIDAAVDVHLDAVRRALSPVEGSRPAEALAALHAAIRKLSEERIEAAALASGYRYLHARDTGNEGLAERLWDEISVDFDRRCEAEVDRARDQARDELRDEHSREIDKLNDEHDKDRAELERTYLDDDEILRKKRDAWESAADATAELAGMVLKHLGTERWDEDIDLSRLRRAAIDAQEAHAGAQHTEDNT